jgi:hypothetical protein
MTKEQIAHLEAEVDALDAARARRVARLVLECRAPLRDALEAVRLADTVSEAQRSGGQRRRWQRLHLAWFRRAA